MLRNKLVKSDGSVIDSSVILSCEYTEGVNSATNLTLGDTTSSELTVEVLSTVEVEAGEVLTYYIIENNVETKIGVFNVDKPTRVSRNHMRFSAYDNLSKTEKNFSDWLRSHRGEFPMQLSELVGHACEYCGVTLAATEIPLEWLEVDAFYADNITCRQILKWAGAIACRFVVANADGEIEFKWFDSSANVVLQPVKNDGVIVKDDGNGNLSITSPDLIVTDDGEGNITLDSDKLSLKATATGVSIEATEQTIPYFRDALSRENYTTDPIERVQIKQSDDDVGVVYPPAADGNCFVISGNMMLGAVSRSDVQMVARHIHGKLASTTYVPFSATVPQTMKVRAGDIVRVKDADGKEVAGYVMDVSVTPSGTTIRSTGDQSYGSNVAVAAQQYQNINGKIMSLKQSVDGLEIVNKDLSDTLSSLSLSAEEFKTYVSGTYVPNTEFDEYKSNVSTQFTQTARDFEMKFTSTNEAIADVNQDLQNKYNERTSYIRFEEGNIILGKSDSNILLVIRNDRISFVQGSQGGPEVAYLADNSLYITEGEFLTQLRIGKFGFIPGANGNLSFKKVVS